MSERRALFQAVLTEPDADAPRLVFADWLEEYGDDFDRGWAELIRVQIAKSKVIEGGPAWRKLDRADRGRRERYRGQLLAPFKGLALSGHVARGFVERLTLHARRFMTQGDRLFAMTPLRTMRFVTLAGRNRNEPTFPELLDSALVGNLRGLEFPGSRPSHASCAALALHPHTRQLRSLNLHGAGLGDDHLAALFPGSGWPRLTELQIDRNDFTPNGVQHLGRGSLAGLESLCVSGSLCSPGAIRALADLNLPALRHLDASGCAFTNDAVNSLANARFARQLAVLGLSTRGQPYGRFAGLGEGLFSDEGLLALVRSEHLKQLRSLDISGQSLTEVGLRVLLEPGVFPRMECLDLCGIAIGKELRAELRQRYGAGVCRLSAP